MAAKSLSLTVSPAAEANVLSAVDAFLARLQKTAKGDHLIFIGHKRQQYRDRLRAIETIPHPRPRIPKRPSRSSRPRAA